MATVEFTGWDVGFQTVRFQHLLRSAGLSLKDSHIVVGEILDRKPVRRTIRGVDPGVFVQYSKNLGVESRILDDSLAR